MCRFDVTTRPRGFLYLLNKKNSRTSEMFCCFAPTVTRKVICCNDSTRPLEGKEGNPTVSHSNFSAARKRGQGEKSDLTRNSNYGVNIKLQCVNRMNTVPRALGPLSTDTVCVRVVHAALLSIVVFGSSSEQPLDQ